MNREYRFITTLCKRFISSVKYRSSKAIHFRTTTREISIKEVCDCTNSSIHLLFHLLGRRSLRFSKEISTSPNTLILGNAGGEYYDNVFIPDWLNNTQWTANSRVRQNDNGVEVQLKIPSHAESTRAISKITSEILTGKLQVVGGVERKIMTSIQAVDSFHLLIHYLKNIN
jgi:hypothetical protein